MSDQQVSGFKHTGWATALLIIAIVFFSTVGERAVSSAGVGLAGIVVNLLMAAGALAISVVLVLKVNPRANYETVYRITSLVFGTLLLLVLLSLFVEPATPSELISFGGLAVQVIGMIGLWARAIRD